MRIYANECHTAIWPIGFVVQIGLTPLYLRFAIANYTIAPMTRDKIKFGWKCFLFWSLFYVMLHQKTFKAANLIDDKFTDKVNSFLFFLNIIISISKSHNDEAGKRKKVYDAIMLFLFSFQEKYIHFLPINWTE